MKTDRASGSSTSGAAVPTGVWGGRGRTLPRRVNRREFLRRAAAGAGVLGLPQLVPMGVRGAGFRPAPSERVTVALIGCGAMGSGHLRRLAGDPAFEVVGVCDVDRSRREAAQAVVTQVYAADADRGHRGVCSAVNDHQELLGRADLDAVVVVTPDHWHTLQAVEAVRAGKDVYLEKPVSLTVAEGRQLVTEVRRYGRVLQTGTQYRSIPVIRQICRFIREGRLGRVRQVFTLLNPVALWLGQDRCKPLARVLTPGQWTRTYVPLDFALPAEPVPDGLDWERWVGPAPWRAYNRLYHTNPSPGVVPWSFDAAFGATSLTWHLAHSADVIQWALGMERSGPVEILHPSAGHFPTFTCRYASGTLLHFVDHWGMVKELYRAVPAAARLAGNFGGVFVGERGWVTTQSTGGTVEGGPESLFGELQLPTREVHVGTNDHHANWLACIRNRQTPACDEELGHRSASLGHLVNLSAGLGCSLTWDPVAERVTHLDPANRLLSRSMRAPWSL